MRVLLDTNVLIAALLSRGTCAELLEHCASNHTLVSGEALLAELHEKLSGNLGFPVREAREVVNLLRTRLEIVDHPPLAEAVCRDPDDDQVLAAALADGCDCIVTGDKDLLVLERFRGIPIVTPTEFWRLEVL
ncbi:MAG: putative toxin-antitoxin system toxin component, PIN family [Candidatus Binatia bacterium]